MSQQLIDLGWQKYAIIKILIEYWHSIIIIIIILMLKTKRT